VAAVRKDKGSFRQYNKRREGTMRPVLFVSRNMETLALETVARSSKKIVMGRIMWETFSDSFPKIFIENVGEIRNRDAVFLASFDTPGAIFEQLGVIYALPRYGVKSLKVILPYFPTGTMERVDEEGQVATAMTLARMLSVIPPTKSGPAEVVIYDIHALQERFYFRDGVIPRLESGIPLLKARLQDMIRVAIAFPDEGAWKRFHRMFDGYPQILCDKVRNGDMRVVTIKEGDPRDMNVVIVDDLVQTGGTLHACKDALFAARAATVSAYVTHGVFPKESWRTFVASDFSHIWITDSCPLTAQAVRGKTPFEVLSLAPLIDPIILS
jgi:ribose-phosphate pyrophosphokinase